MTDPFDAAAAAGHQLQQQVAALTAKDAADEAALAAETAKYNDAEAQIAALQPQPIAWGGQVTRQGTETYAQALARMDAKWGKLKAVRFYDPPGQNPRLPIATIPAANQLPTLGGRVLLYSFKPDPATVTAGSVDAAMVAFCKDATAYLAAHPEDTIVWTWMHEPDAKARKGQFTAAAYRTAGQRLLDAFKPYKSPRFLSSQIFTGWLVDPANNAGDNLDSYYLPDVDLLGWDPYVEAATSDPAAIYGRCRDASTGKGKPWFIGETAANNSIPQAQWNTLMQAMAHNLATVAPLPVAVAVYDDLPQYTANADAVAAWRAGQGG